MAKARALPRMKSWLFAPGDSEKKLAKAIASEADIALLDLEDSVAPENKPAARRLIAAVLAPLRNHRAKIEINNLFMECIVSSCSVRAYDGRGDTPHRRQR